MLEIKKIDNKYNLILNDFNINEEGVITTPNTTWFLLKKAFLEERMNDYNIKEGDIIRIGRITIKIKKIKFYHNNKKDDDISIHTNLKEVGIVPKYKMSSLIDKKENSKYKICRICYLEEETSANPLIQPCVCSGSMKYIHLNCLKQWIHTSIFVKIDGNQDCFIYLYRTPECELCKTKFTDYIRIRGKTYEILDFKNDFNSYMVIESLTLDKNNNKYIYVVNLDVPNNKINVGRGHDCSLLLSDISVSRWHCFLTVDKSAKKIYLHDNNSKFGTLILVQAKQLMMCLNLKLCIQIGRTFLELSIKEPFHIFSCCNVSEKKNADFYYLQNKEKLYLFNKLTIKTEYDVEHINKCNLQREEEKVIDNLITENNLLDDEDINLQDIKKEDNESNEVNISKEDKKENNSFDDIEKLINEDVKNNKDNNNNDIVIEPQTNRNNEAIENKSNLIGNNSNNNNQINYSDINNNIFN